MEQRPQNDACRDRSREIGRHESRKPYRSPRLVSYGDFHRLTRDVTGPVVASEGTGGSGGTKTT